MDRDEIIKRNPGILEDEVHYPDVRKVYRKHYQDTKRDPMSRTVDYIRIIPVHLETDEELEERKWNEYYDSLCHSEDDLDAVGGEPEALCNLY